MAEAETQSTQQCKALTEDGERCSRPAQDDGFCYQHDDDDPTVDESEVDESDADESEADEEADGEDADGEEAETEADETDGDGEDDVPDGGDESGSESTETESMSETQTEAEPEETEESSEGPGGTAIRGGADETTDPGQVDADVDPDEEGIASILEIRRTVQSTAGELIGYEFDGVSEISPTDDGWRGVVEVVERSSIPDTMDILGRYEIDLSEDGTVRGYRRIDRYHRNDTDEFVE